MNYEEFKTVLKENICSYLPQQCNGMKAFVKSLEKGNCILDKVILYGNGILLISAFNLYNLYTKYNKCMDVNMIIERAAKYLYLCMRDKHPGNIIDMSRKSDNIIVQLMNTDQNSELLEQIPHRELLDMSIIYRWVIKKSDNTVSSIIIDHELAAVLEFSEQELFSVAMKKTPEILPPRAVPLIDIVDPFHLLGVGRESENILLKWPLVITNECNYLGAWSMLDTKWMSTLADMAKEDLYVLPSSIHDLIIMPVSMGNAGVLVQMVEEANNSCVKDKCRLSNKAYIFDQSKKWVRESYSHTKVSC